MNFFNMIRSYITNVADALVGSKKEQEGIVDAKQVVKKQEPKVQVAPITFSHRQMVWFWVIGAIVVYISYLIFQSLAVLYLIITALFISIAMETFIQWGQKILSRNRSIAFMYILLILFLLTGFIILFPFLLKQISTIVMMMVNRVSNIGQQIATLGLTGYINSLTWIPQIMRESLIDTIGTDAKQIQTMLMGSISSLVSMGSSYVANVGSFALSALGSVVSVLFKVVLILVISIFFSIEKDSIVNLFVHHTSSTATHSNFMSEKVTLFYKKMGIWLQTQLGLSLFIFIVVYSALLILSLFGLKLPSIFSLALIAGFTEFIPYLGPFLGVIPTLLVATLLYGWKGFIVIGFIYFIIQQIENHLLVPTLMNRSLGVSSLLIVISALFFGTVLGILGVILAVPFAILITVIMKKDFE